MIQGTPASDGLAIGPAWVFKPGQVVIEHKKDCEPDDELTRLRKAVFAADEQLQKIFGKAVESVGENEAKIFEVHQMFLTDPEYIGLIKDRISGDHFNAEAAIEQGTEAFAETLEAMDNEYFKARAADIRDVGRRLIYALHGINPDNISLPQNPVIILAEDLSPSDTIQFNKDRVLGICTLKGGPTSHTAILARTLGVPAVVSAHFQLDSIEPNSQIILDGTKGQLVFNPDEKTIQSALQQQEATNKHWQALLKHSTGPATTQSGETIEVAANIGSVDQAQQAIKYGADGIGLLRTEFLYLNRNSMPTEGEQTAIYRQIADVVGKERPIVVRTIDIGGDKAVSYLGINDEPNPFLGWRAIRMINERPDILETQFRALLQGFAGSNLKIMLPFISSIEEIREAKNLFKQAQSYLEKEKVEIATNVQIGTMVEVPSVAIMSEQIAPEVDFFSIGTNDLTQYTLAVDRTNERVASLANYFHPAVLQLIHTTITAAHLHGKWVGLCGEMAGDPKATRILLGFGLDEFSMAPGSIPNIKHLLRQQNLDECQDLAQEVLRQTTVTEVLDLLG
ncbi:MAG: phosphoenolpyruvate--protein phosphotransferase [Chloroflexota bacterium]